MSKNYKYFIGFGGNIGEVEQAFAFALARLEQHLGRATGLSSIYLSAALQDQASSKSENSQNDFLNCVACFKTEQKEILNLLSKIESDLGRVRSRKWGDRIIDLDIIACDDFVYASDILKIPHPEMHKRSFVLMPMLEIAPMWIHPVLKKTAKQLLECLENPTPCKILKPFPRCES